MPGEFTAIEIPTSFIGWQLHFFLVVVQMNIDPFLSFVSLGS
jgi:hypothetical protein